MREKIEELTTTIHEPENENCECPYCIYERQYTGQKWMKRSRSEFNGRGIKS